MLFLLQKIFYKVIWYGHIYSAVILLKSCNNKNFVFKNSKTVVNSTKILLPDMFLSISFWQQCCRAATLFPALPVPSYLRSGKCLLYPGGGRAQKGSPYHSTCTWASADSTLVGAELRRGPPTILLALVQVLTLPWWWQSLEVVPVPSYLHWGKC